MSNLNKINGSRFYRIMEYSNWKKLTVKYWLDYSKNQYGNKQIVEIDLILNFNLFNLIKDFKFSIFIGENGDFLQTTHYPFLNWRDHKNIDEILKKDDLLIEKVIHSIIKYRSKKRLIVSRKSTN